MENRRPRASLRRRSAPPTRSSRFSATESNLFQLAIAIRVYDIFYFFLFEIVDKDIVFKICKRCDKYFPCLYNKNIQFCDRVDAALDKTCREIKLETLPDTDDVKHKADVMELFKRTYERVRHRVRRTKEQQKKYKEWSKEARSLRDRCISGEITLDYFEEWLSKTEQEMM